MFLKNSFKTTREKNHLGNKVLLDLI